jgi:hypothetical protein
MADFQGIAAATSSIRRLLERCCDAQRGVAPVRDHTTRVNAVRTDDMSPDGTAETSPPALTLFLYRIDFNKSLRAAWSAIGHQDGESHLPLDLHFLLTAWGSSADDEYRILGRAMQCLENTPILSGPLLDPAFAWRGTEAVQVCLEDLSNEDVMRIFDSLPVDYRLSIPYVARVVVIDGGERRPAPAVTRQVRGLKPSVAEDAGA